MTTAAIYGCAGHELTQGEADFFASVAPFGFILFARNVASPEQVRQLCLALRQASGRPEAPILIDQEGGRVQRLRPPHWPVYPPGHIYGRFDDKFPLLGQAFARLGARLIAHDLLQLGITADAVPVLDIPQPGAHDVIGDRAYGETVAAVARLGRAAAEGLLAGGVLPIIKHIPGHGRALCDSHLALPRVEASRDALSRTDFAPFRALSDMPMAMTAHVVYAALDPRRPATTSRRVISDTIRTDIGFQGLLMSDDLSMQALTGDLTTRAKASLRAGCDVVLHCNGNMTEMEAVARGTPTLRGESAKRAAAALARAPKLQEPLDEDAARAQFQLWWNEARA